MRISHKADYGLRLVMELARVYPDGRLPTYEIAKRQDIPEPFLAKIVAELSQSGIVDSKRGMRGGVRLARPPEEVTLFDVINALDGPFAFAPCLRDPEFCSFQQNCPMEEALKGAQRVVAEYLSSITFAQIVGQKATSGVPAQELVGVDTFGDRG